MYNCTECNATTLQHEPSPVCPSCADGVSLALREERSDLAVENKAAQFDSTRIWLKGTVPYNTTRINHK